MRFRKAYALFGSILVAVLWLLTDPDLGLISKLPIGAGLLSTLIFLSKGVLASTLLYITRKAMFDYKAADIEELGNKARQTPEGAGVYSIGLGLQTLAYAVVIVGAFYA